MSNLERFKQTQSAQKQIFFYRTFIYRLKEKYEVCKSPTKHSKKKSVLVVLNYRHQMENGKQGLDAFIMIFDSYIICTIDT